MNFAPRSMLEYLLSAVACRAPPRKFKWVHCALPRNRSSNPYPAESRSSRGGDSARVRRIGICVWSGSFEAGPMCANWKSPSSNSRC